MHISAILALSWALAADLVSAGPLMNVHMHNKPARLAHRHSSHGALQPRQDSGALSASGLAKLQSLGFGSQAGVPATGVNAQSGGTEGVWIGADGPYTSTFTNTSPNEVVLVVWGSTPAYQASFPEAVQPLITASLPGGGAGSVTLSFASGQSGAFAGVYQDTTMTQWGQISNTWGEFTMGPSGVVDVSREVYANGNTLSIVGPTCTADMDTCVFTCNDPTVSTCGAAGSYSILNCSQPGAQVSPDNTSGGCGWSGAATGQFATTFS